MTGTKRGAARTGAVAMLMAAILMTGSACGLFGGPAPWPACTGATPERGCSVPRDLALVIGAHKNSPAPTPLPDAVATLAASVAAGGKKITLVQLDGRPKMVDRQAFHSDAQNQSAWDADLDEFLNGMTTRIGKIVPQAPESDPLEALAEAARNAPGDAIIAMIDSGLSTKTIDFTQDGMLEASPDQVVNELVRRQQLPDLSGRTVQFSGLGQTTLPQQSLDQARRKNLIEIWKAIAARAGARDIWVDESSRPDRPVETDQPVTVVPVRPLDPAPAPRPEGSCTESVFRDVGNVGFTPEKANFRDAGAARDTLHGFASQITSGNAKAELIGTTAAVGDEQGRLTLSQQRAEAVRQVLIELGVPSDRITSRGVGSRWPGRVPDTDAQGNLLPGAAALNRSVILRVGC
jgi:OmpA-OmpF porin, OOP family